MKNLLLTLLLFVPCSEIVAQNSFGMRIGYNNTNATKISENSITGGLNRYQVFVYAKRYVYKSRFLKANLGYDQRGNFYDDIHAIADGGKKLNKKLNYAEFSVDMGYTYQVRAHHQIHAGFGPYLAYGISGTEKGYGGTFLAGCPLIEKFISLIQHPTKEPT